MLERLAGSLRREGVNVTLDCDQDLSILLRPIAFERVLNNLLGNARKYGGDIWISAHLINEH